jgi:hypothetical protein
VREQLALALTGGYRGRFPLAASSQARDGVYVALDYNYLLGFRYEDFDTALRLDTDAQGLLTVNPFAGSPLVVGRDHSSSGRGFAIDVGVGVVADRLELGVGVKGLSNRMEWTNVERTAHTLSNLILGGAFVESPDVARPDVDVELPHDVRAYAGFRTGSGTFVGDLGRGFQGTSFHGGYEHNLGVIDVRGGALYSRETWQPTGGIGVNVGRRLSLDLAMYGTSTNVERERKAAVAVSLRYNQQS